MASPILTITRAMPVAEIVTFFPEVKNMLAEYGLHCFHCAGSAYETLEEGCRSHGFGDDEIGDLVEDLQTFIERLPRRPQELTVTKEAAEGLAQIAKDEGKTEAGLAVITDGHGGFCLEFRTEPEADEKIFMHPDVSSVRVFASPLTLLRIGGATIDMRDGRFKLDLREDEPNTCGCSGESCGCRK